MTIRVQRRVPAAQLAVWEAWLNLPQWSSWAPGVRQVEVDWTGDPPPGGSARLQTATGWRRYEVTAVHPPETWTWRWRLGPWTVTAHHHLQDRGDATTEAAILVSFDGPAGTVAETVARLGLRPVLARRLAALADLFRDGSAGTVA
ncbi:MAG: SRPBCC family protein [Actinomycetota bacterium]|nr:SRPBCC family protein [Actinomycetota bacterium]